MPKAGDHERSDERLDAFGDLLRGTAGDGLAPTVGVPSPPGADAPAAGERAGRYDLTAELGRGGMGVVWRAWDPELRRQVAVKMIRGAAGEHARARFEREARAAARLRHPGIVRIYEVGADDAGRPFIVMDLIDGEPLDALLDRADDRPSPRRIAEIVRDVCRALEHAHDAGVIHRDVKPQNILVDRDGRPHLTDFGLAQNVDATTQGRLTVTGAVLGTPAYMAPEQARGMREEQGPATDVWAVGAVLYRAIVGRAPFQGDGVLAVLQQVLYAEPPAPRSVDPTIHADLETIVVTCLAKEPARRYATAGLLADDLDHFLAGRAITARPIGRLERARAWAERHRALVLAATILLVGLAILGAIEASRMSAIAARERDVAMAERRANEERERSRARIAAALDDLVDADELAVVRATAELVDEPAELVVPALLDAFDRAPKSQRIVRVMTATLGDLRATSQDGARQVAALEKVARGHDDERQALDAVLALARLAEAARAVGEGRESSRLLTHIRSALAAIWDDGERTHAFWRPASRELAAIWPSDGPDLERAPALRGLWLRARGDFVGALEALGRADGSNARAEIGWIHFERLDQEASVASFAEAHAEFPDRADFAVAHAVMSAIWKPSRAALELAIRTAGAHPGQALAWCAVGFAFIRISREDPERAGNVGMGFAYLAHAIAVDDREPIAWTCLAVAQQSVGAIHAAEVSIERAFALDPESTWILHTSAITQRLLAARVTGEERRRHVARGLDHIDRALRQTPDFIDFHKERLRLRILELFDPAGPSGAIDDLLPELDALVTRSPKDATVLSWRGLARVSIGTEAVEGTADLIRAVELDPGIVGLALAEPPFGPRFGPGTGLLAVQLDTAEALVAFAAGRAGDGEAALERALGRVTPPQRHHARGVMEVVIDAARSHPGAGPARAWLEARGDD